MIKCPVCGCSANQVYKVENATVYRCHWNHEWSNTLTVAEALWNKLYEQQLVSCPYSELLDREQSMLLSTVNRFLETYR